MPKVNLKTIKLVVGLGNPDKEYANTYHNVGFLAVDYLKNQAADAQYKIEKSSVFMNQSGGFVKKALKKYGVEPNKLLVIHDDSDIELGKRKFSFGRGSAGHKGVESIIKSLKTKNFWRLRLGIRKEKNKKAGDFVLKKINKNDREILEKTLAEIKIV